jgi:hypothetical protein
MPSKFCLFVLKYADWRDLSIIYRTVYFHKLGQNRLFFIPLKPNAQEIAKRFYQHIF